MGQRDSFIYNDVAAVLLHISNGFPHITFIKVSVSDQVLGGSLHSLPPGHFPVPCLDILYFKHVEQRKLFSNLGLYIEGILQNLLEFTIQIFDFPPVP